MREATKEEIDSVNQYVEQISVPTGINFYDSLIRALENDITDIDVAMSIITTIEKYKLERCKPWKIGK